jgi:flagellar biosynthesis/type III secretory pathway protein FliH
LDLRSFEKNIEEKVIELVNSLTGKVIKELPKEFIKQIKGLLSQLENIEGNIDIYINERDYKVIESNKNIKNEIEKLSIKADKELNHGEIELKVNGITIRKTIR